MRMLQWWKQVIKIMLEVLSFLRSGEGLISSNKANSANFSGKKKKKNEAF